MNRRRPADPERDRRRAIKRETDRQLAALRGTTPTTTRAKRTPTDKIASRIRPGVVAELHDLGADLGIGGAVTIGRLRPAHRGPGAPLRVDLYDSPAQPKSRRVVAPSWLALVRMMPCGECGTGLPFYEQLRLGVSQSEANHHPPKRKGGGGSDLETHPLCSECHRAVTEMRPTRRGLIATADRLRSLVALSGHAIHVAIREGRVHPGILVAAGIEALVSDGS